MPSGNCRPLVAVGPFTDGFHAVSVGIGAPGPTGATEEKGCGRQVIDGIVSAQLYVLTVRQGPRLDTSRPTRRRFRSIRLHVRGADVEILDVHVIYANGAPDELSVKHFLRQGERTRPLDLRGWERSIDRVEMRYRTVPNFKGLATVCVEGAQ